MNDINRKTGSSKRALALHKSVSAESLPAREAVIVVSGVGVKQTVLHADQRNYLALICLIVTLTVTMQTIGNA